MQLDLGGRSRGRDGSRCRAATRYLLWESSAVKHGGRYFRVNFFLSLIAAKVLGDKVPVEACRSAGGDGQDTGLMLGTHEVLYVPEVGVGGGCYKSLPVIQVPTWEPRGEGAEATLELSGGFLPGFMCCPSWPPYWPSWSPHGVPRDPFGGPECQPVTYPCPMLVLPSPGGGGVGGKVSGLKG